MLERLTVRGFKSLRDVTFEPGEHLTVLFGANAAGKTNLVESIAALAALATGAHFHDALDSAFPVRGNPAEVFAFPPPGLPALLRSEGPDPTFSIGADLSTKDGAYRYRIAPRLRRPSGHLSVADEYLIQTRAASKAKPLIERTGERLRIRGDSPRVRLRYETLGHNHSMLSFDRFFGPGYERFHAVRHEFRHWRSYALEPRFQMRSIQFPADVKDIGPHGQNLASFLHKLHAAAPKHFESLILKLRVIVPAVEGLRIHMDPTRGSLDTMVSEGGTEYSSALVSEGTLRALGLCAIAVNPWRKGGLLTIEEPENGVHPRRLDLLARLLLSLGQDGRHQVIVTTHSTQFVGTVLKMKRDSEQPDGIRLFNVRHANSGNGRGTNVEAFELPQALLDDPELTHALADRGDAGLFEGLLLRGYLDD